MARLLKRSHRAGMGLDWTRSLDRCCLPFLDHGASSVFDRHFAFLRHGGHARGRASPIILPFEAARPSSPTLWDVWGWNRHVPKNTHLQTSEALRCKTYSPPSSTLRLMRFQQRDVEWTQEIDEDTCSPILACVVGRQRFRDARHERVQI